MGYKMVVVIAGMKATLIVSDFHQSFWVTRADDDQNIVSRQ